VTHRSGCALPSLRCLPVRDAPFGPCSPRVFTLCLCTLKRAPECEAPVGLCASFACSHWRVFFGCFSRWTCVRERCGPTVSGLGATQCARSDSKRNQPTQGARSDEDGARAPASTPGGVSADSARGRGGPARGAAVGRLRIRRGVRRGTRKSHEADVPLRGSSAGAGPAWSERPAAVGSDAWPCDADLGAGGIPPPPSYP